jgi:uncharacterized membrane protein HdeD (DUF308 family)
MEDELAQDHAEEQPQARTMRHPPQADQSNKARRWPRAMGIVLLAFGHLAFFLPLRAFVPVSPGIDPWWGLGLVVVDGAACVMLIRMGLRKLMRRNTPKENE